jgi:hypothetical protein
MPNPTKFGVLVLTYGRPHNVYTYETLRRQGYTGPIWLVCSTDDAKLEQYQEKYGKEVIVFSKDTYKGRFDIGDNLQGQGVVVYARNAAWDIAQSLGLDYFLELDDDYNSFRIRYPTKGKLAGIVIQDLDSIFRLFVNYLHTTKTLTSVAFAQGGDFIGGVENGYYNVGYVGKKRKVMNTFFHATARPYTFPGRINEDVNAYIDNGKRGKVFLTHPLVCVVQMVTQSNPGGLTEAYLNLGTYVKSFYTILFNPSAVRILTMGRNDRRIHHRVKWDNAVPCIIRENWRNGNA